MGIKRYVHTGLDHLFIHMQRIIYSEVILHVRRNPLDALSL